MACFECIKICPTNALEIDEEASCARLLGSPALRINEEKCNECNLCMKVCPMGNINLSGDGCSFCIICRGDPNCILSCSGRNSFLNFNKSTARFMVVFMRRLIFQ